MATLQNKPLKAAKSKDITLSLNNKEINFTPKQTEIELLMGPYLENNFKIIHESKLRIKTKSHCFLRNTNALSRQRDNNCIFCYNQRDSINHILYECNIYKYYANKILKITNKLFNLKLICDERYLIILDKDIRINIFQMINQKVFWNLRCRLIHVGATFDDTQWENLIQMEVERYLNKEIFLSNNREELLEFWSSIIENFDPETKLTKLINIFQ